MKNPRRPAAITNDRTRSVAWPSPFPPLCLPGVHNNNQQREQRQQQQQKTANITPGGTVPSDQVLDNGIILGKCWAKSEFDQIYSILGYSHNTKISNFGQIRNNFSPPFASRFSPSREQVTDNPFHNFTTRTRLPPVRGVTVGAREYRCNV